MTAIEINKDRSRSGQMMLDAIKHEAEEREKPRPHLGASLLGHHCTRYLWLSFRWAVREDFDGRMYRLFRRGQNEEASVVADLRAAGMNVTDTDQDGNQYRVHFSHHISGSMDGVILSGVPEAPKKPHVLEIKTHNKKSFDRLERLSVEESNPMHWCQMQVYMHGSDIDRALYVAVCKDDDRIYTERVRYSPDDAIGLLQRAQDDVIDAPDLPLPVSTDPTWYQCKVCPAHAFCHSPDQNPVRHVNCRTCAHSTATAQGWVCERWNGEPIPLDVQREGCRSHVPHPGMVPWPIESGVGDWSAAFNINGERMIIGEDGMDSREVMRRAP